MQNQSVYQGHRNVNERRVVNFCWLYIKLIDSHMGVRGFLDRVLYRGHLAFLYFNGIFKLVYVPKHP